MNINVETQPNCRAILRAEVPAEQVKTKRSEILAYFASQAQFPGFRPGKVPASIIEKRFGDSVKAELEDQLVRAALNEAMTTQNLRLVDANVTERVVQSDGSFTLTVEVSTVPVFDLPDYKGIPVKLAKIELTDHEVEHEIYHLRENRSDFADVDRAAAMGDVVVLSYTVSIDGKPTEETHPDLAPPFKKMEGNWFLLAENDDLIAGFNAALVGIAKDDSKTISITVPDDFHAEALRGQKLDFAVTCSGVKKRTIPEFNEEFAKSFLGDNGTTEQLRTLIKESVENRKNRDRDTEFTNQILAHLHDKLPFEIPESLVAREAQRRTNDIAMQAARAGMSQEDLTARQEEIVNTATQQAAQGVRVSFILEKIADKEELTVTDSQVVQRLMSMAERRREKPDKFMKQAQRDGTIDQVRDQLRIDAAIAFLKDNATVEEIEATADKHDCAFEKGEAA